MALVIGLQSQRPACPRPAAAAAAAGSDDSPYTDKEKNSQPPPKQFKAYFLNLFLILID